MLTSSNFVKRWVNVANVVCINGPALLRLQDKKGEIGGEMAVALIVVALVDFAWGLQE